MSLLFEHRCDTFLVLIFGKDIGKVALTVGEFKFHAVVALCAAFWLGGCSKPEDTNASAPVPNITMSSLKDLNLVLIVIDSLRADHLGCYGYDKATTPFIDSLAADGLVFDRASANSSYITQSLSTLFSGRLPTSGGTVGLFESHPLDETSTLPQWFGRAGYYTGIVSNQPLVKGKGFTKGFEDLQIGNLDNPWSGYEVSDRALDFTDDAADDKFMLYVHYLDPHQPYTPLDEFYERFGGGAAAEPLDLLAFRKDYGVAISVIEGPENPDVEELVRRYDAEIAYTDHCIERFVKGLEEQGKLDRTTIVITSNHGEEFLEHGYVGNAWTLFDEVLHVPLIVWAPGAVEPGRIGSRVSLVDLAPTLLNLFEISAEVAGLDGEALFASKGDRFAFRPPEKPQIAELVIRERAIVRSVVVGDWKYIASSNWAPPGERYSVATGFRELTKGMQDGTIEPPPPWGAGGFEALYNLKDDPDEAVNLLDKGGDALERVRGALAAYEKYCAENALEPRDAVGVHDVLDPDEIEDLESLGYL